MLCSEKERLGLIASAISTVPLASAQVMDAVLCTVLLLRKRWRRFPALLAFVLLDLIATVLISSVAPYNTHAYTYLYLGYSIASFFAQLFVLYELAKDVLQPQGFWNRLALVPLSLRAAIGVIVALAASIFLPASHLQPLQAWLMRSDAFTSFVICGSVLALFGSANRLGLPWRSHAIAVGGGLMFWTLFNASLEGFQAYLDPQRSYDVVTGYLRVADYLLVVSYWCVSLWRNEPARRPISPALQKYVLALHERVHYDLGKVGH